MNKTRVAALIATGLKDIQVASIIGCSPARISQLRTESDFQLLLTEAEVDNSKKDIEQVALSAKYLNAEHALVDQIMAMAATAEMSEAVSALRVISQRQIENRKVSQPVPQQGGNTTNVTFLQLPTHIVGQLQMPNIEITPGQEVISVGGRNLAPLSSSAVTNLFKRMSSTPEMIEVQPDITEIQPDGGYHDPSTANDAPDSSFEAALSAATAQASL